MKVASVLIVDDDPQRLALSREWLQGGSYEIIGAMTEESTLANAESNKIDLILLRLSLGVDVFHRVAAASRDAGTFIAPIVEGWFPPDFRKHVLELKADGFISEELPKDEKIALIDALLRTKRAMDELKRRIGDGRSPATSPGELKKSELQENYSSGSTREERPLRDRSPELYKELLRRYEEAVKLFLQNRIYKISDDIFEPFRRIARQLFQADATARDAVELHYQTLRKIAPTPEAPRAQAYLEVGRTTIVGLLGDLITCYREASRRQGSVEKADER